MGRGGLCGLCGDGVLLDVLDHAVPSAETGLAVGTGERRLPCVAKHVPGQVLGALEGRLAVRARVRPASQVLRAPVLIEQPEVGKVLGAVYALQLGLRSCEQTRKISDKSYGS